MLIWKGGLEFVVLAALISSARGYQVCVHREDFGTADC